MFIGSQVNVVDLVRLIITIVVFMITFLHIGIKFVPKILNWVGNNTSTEVFLVLSIGLCFTMVWLSALVEMSMAIGAFLTGVMVSQSKFSKHIIEKIEPMKEVFMDVFFISVGMSVYVPRIFK